MGLSFWFKCQQTAVQLAFDCYSTSRPITRVPPDPIPEIYRTGVALGSLPLRFPNLPLHTHTRRGKPTCRARGGGQASVRVRLAAPSSGQGSRGLPVRSRARGQEGLTLVKEEGWRGISLSWHWANLLHECMVVLERHISRGHIVVGMGVRSYGCAVVLSQGCSVPHIRRVPFSASWSRSF